MVKELDFVRPNWRERLRALVSKAGQGGLDLVLPPQCLGCSAFVDSPGRLCGDCWTQTTFIAEPLCKVCGVPFPGEGPDASIAIGSTCGACLASPPAYACARAAVVYDGVGRELAHQIKFKDRLESASPLASMMVRAAREELTNIQLIVPVPLHYIRLVTRRHNQSLTLAREVARQTGIDLSVDALKRVRRTQSQVGLTASQRHRNVQGAFAVRKRHQPLIAGKQIALIDDVLTTGATVSACAKTLLRAGAASVIVLTLARAGSAL